MSTKLTETSNTEPFGDNTEELKLGTWYWVTEEVEWNGQWHNDDGTYMKKGEKAEWLGCAMEIGSNFIGLQSPHRNHSYHSLRVHFDDFDKVLRVEKTPEDYIEKQRLHYQRKVNALLGEVREITARLGVVPKKMIGDKESGGDSGNALVTVSQQPDTTAYKNALIKAKDVDLPELFRQIESANEHLAKWMNAPTLPLMASIGPMKESIGQIKDRIHTIELYAGLTEEAVCCKKGKPAEPTDKLHVMQRRLYMDEECLANYKAGGMDFKDVEAFDRWLSRAENLTRLLPFSRTLVAFRVRRERKDREDFGNFLTAWINFKYEINDKKTYLYVRNGQQLWRIDCDLDFEEMIVPNKDDFNPSEPMMVLMRNEQVQNIMPKSRWEFLVVEEREEKRKFAEWEKANPSSLNNPHRHSYFDKYEDYEPFDPSNVYFDEALEHVESEIKRYNRIAVIVQGLFDRSEVLHPHLPVKMWEAESFSRSVELVYDAMTLTHGDKPDFEAFRERLNILITADSVLTGQEDYWARKEAVRENARQANDWRLKNPSHYKRYRPYGNPGPVEIGKPDGWKVRARKATFKWKRAAQSMGRYGQMIDCSIDVPITALFNVSAYQPGDFRQFYSDPRTRREYIQWAPFLLAAEDWHAGKRPKKKDGVYD